MGKHEEQQKAHTGNRQFQLRLEVRGFGFLPGAIALIDQDNFKYRPGTQASEEHQAA